MRKIIDSFNDFIKKYHLESFKDVALFMGILLIFHFLYRYFAQDFLAVDFIKNSGNSLARNVFLESKWVLELFNVNVTSLDVLDIDGSVKSNVFYYAANNGYTSVGLGCSGLKQLYQWTVLMLFYPGSWKNKLWYIPMGLVVVHLTNVFRILLMVFVTINLPEHWHFIHDYIARPFFYVVMFAMWVYWNEHYYHKKEKKKVKS